MPVTNGGFVAKGAAPQPIANAGPPTDGVDEVQRLTSTATGGTFAVTFINPFTGRSATTAPIVWNATAAAIQAALRALPNMPAAGVVGSGGPLNSAFVAVAFAGALSGMDIAPMTVDNALATGGTVVQSTTTAGVAGTGRGQVTGGLLIDTVTPKVHQNAGTAEKPVWQKVGTQT